MSSALIYILIFYILYTLFYMYMYVYIICYIYRYGESRLDRWARSGGLMGMRNKSVYIPYDSIWNVI